MAKRYVMAILLMVLCATSQIGLAEDSYTNPADPHERFNRAMFGFNEVIDQNILKPIATLYNKLPNPVTKGIGNFFSNLNNIPTILNDLLQGNFYQTTSDTWRLGINSTIGILGFFDVASHMGLEPNSEDFGLTLAQWGYKNSSYLVLPFLGPSTVRDGIAFPINYQFMTVYPLIYPVRTRYALYGMSVVDKRAELLRYQDVFEQAAIDKYVFMRTAYLQRRQYLIQRNKELGDPYLEKK